MGPLRCIRFRWPGVRRQGLLPSPPPPPCASAPAIHGCRHLAMDPSVCPLIDSPTHPVPPAPRPTWASRDASPAAQKAPQQARPPPAPTSSAWKRPRWRTLLSAGIHHNPTPSISSSPIHPACCEPPTQARDTASRVAGSLLACLEILSAREMATGARGTTRRGEARPGFMSGTG